MAATMGTNAYAVPGCGGWAIQETLHMVRYGCRPLCFALQSWGAPQGRIGPLNNMGRISEFLALAGE